MKRTIKEYTAWVHADATDGDAPKMMAKDGLFEVASPLTHMRYIDYTALPAELREQVAKGTSFWIVMTVPFTDHDAYYWIQQWLIDNYNGSISVSCITSRHSAILP